jgi:aspartate-semialdehyde dehydrogenase
VEELSSKSFKGTDIAFFSAGATISREFAPDAMTEGALVVDNSSAFRMDEEVPLIVPEINGASLLPNHRLVANPNCTAAILLMAVNPLRKLATLNRLVVSTYQSASGAGAAAMAELGEQTADVLAGKAVIPKVMPHLYAFNLFSHNTPINEYGYNDEEWKVIQEVRKISSLADLKIGVTCVRVPVMRAHSISVTVEFEGEAPDVEAVREILKKSPGVKLVDDRAANHFPMPNEASGQDDVLVGRIRKDLSHPSAISMFIAGDQLLKGAALNAVQIAELAMKKGFI